LILMLGFWFSLFLWGASLTPMFNMQVNAGHSPMFDHSKFSRSDFQIYSIQSIALLDLDIKIQFFIKDINVCAWTSADVPHVYTELRYIYTTSWALTNCHSLPYTFSDTGSRALYLITKPQFNFAN
jgi:hypothetical protein